MHCLRSYTGALHKIVAPATPEAALNDLTAAIDRLERLAWKLLKHRQRPWSHDDAPQA